MDLMAEQPGDTAVGPEFEEFANALDDCISPSFTLSEQRRRLLQLPSRYHDNITRKLTLLRPNQGRDGHDDVDMDTDEGDGPLRSTTNSAEVERLKKEAQTWDLIRRLLPLRYSDNHSAQSSPPANDNSSSPKDPFQSFLDRDPLTRERQAVLQWLQNNASSGPDIDDLVRELQQSAGRDDIIAHGWLHTRSAIKQRKSVTGWPHLLGRQSPTILRTFLNKNGSPMVTQLDPDVATRTGRKLEPQDEYFERAIWLGCFEHLRRGSSVKAIQEWCEDRTEMWRAVSMSALSLSADSKDPLADTDPFSLCLWRRTCLQLARQGGSDDFERAVYGALSGDVASVEKVCKSWDDHLFANYNAVMRSQLDAFLLKQCSPDAASALQQSFGSSDAASQPSNEENLEKQLIDSLGKKQETAKEAAEPNKALQAAFIAKDMENHLYEQGLTLCRNDAFDESSALQNLSLEKDISAVETKYFKANQHDGVRLIAHIFLLVTLLERRSGTATPAPDKRRIQESILIEYTKFLWAAGLHELIPLYCSILEAPQCYEVLSGNLILEEDNQRRLMQLRLIKKAGIKVYDFVESQALLLFRKVEAGGEVRVVKTQFRILAEKGITSIRLGKAIKEDFFGEDLSDINHEHLVRSLEWLRLAGKTWPTVLSLGTKAYKFFLSNMQLNAARQIMERVPFSSILRDITDQEVTDGAWFNELELWEEQLENIGAQHLSAEQVMRDARNFRELEALVAALDSLETMAGLAVISQEVPPHNREFWGKVSAEIQTTRENMKPLLNKWLVAAIEDGDQELRDLRQTYLPETILAYISALQFAGTGASRDNLLECMELAAVIAANNSELAVVFQRSSRMKELVEALAACSKALAIATGDKRANGSSNKKLREMGWSRDLWSVKS